MARIPNTTFGKSNYLKSLQQILDSPSKKDDNDDDQDQYDQYFEDDKKNLEIVGSGLKPKTVRISGVNPILLFNKLRILIVAKKAGHNNVKEETEKVLNKLKKLGLSDDKRNEKILNKYF